MSFSSFTSTLKLKTHSQLTQSPFTSTDCFFKDFYQNKTMLYSCVMKFSEEFHSTKLHYKRSDLDVLMSVKFNNLPFSWEGRG